ncbi:MAG: hypothetical protein ACRDMV_02315 [Streptosporangiales bacterium]
MMPTHGNTSQRGYGPTHQRLRAHWAPIVAAGGATCHRCSEAIRPAQRWDLGHVDGSGKAMYAGPEHVDCNRRAGQQSGQHGDPDPRPRTDWGKQ